MRLLPFHNATPPPPQVACRRLVPPSCSAACRIDPNSGQISSQRHDLPHPRAALGGGPFSPTAGSSRWQPVFPEVPGVAELHEVAGRARGAMQPSLPPNLSSSHGWRTRGGDGETAAGQRLLLARMGKRGGGGGGSAAAASPGGAGERVCAGKQDCSTSTSARGRIKRVSVSYQSCVPVRRGLRGSLLCCRHRRLPPQT